MLVKGLLDPLTVFPCLRDQDVAREPQLKRCEYTYFSKLCTLNSRRCLFSKLSANHESNNKHFKRDKNHNWRFLGSSGSN